MSEEFRTSNYAMDDGVDDEILECLNLLKPVSFFLFAGAGSGKTRSLVTSIRQIRERYGRQLLLNGQQVAVITYTNAACDEIKQRLEFDALIEVSTIHSFAWSLIGGFTDDIRMWVRENLAKDIADLVEAQRKGRAGKASLERARSIESKQQRLDRLNEVRRFTYSPTGDNRGRDALNHTEVIEIAAAFLTNKPAMQRILVNKYPFLLIDESQDTNRHLMEAFLVVESQHTERFCLGLFGDTMQRIYADGKVDLPGGLPSRWRRPAKKMNHRSPARIVRLINKIRSGVDAHQQIARSDRGEGIARLFVVPNTTADKLSAENEIARRMAEITGDEFWSGAKSDVKTLTLEHLMAARRMGFLEFFEPLYSVDRLKTGLLDGTLSGLRLFTQEVLPLVEAKRQKDEYAVAAIVRKSSPLLEATALKAAGKDQLNSLKRAGEAVDRLLALWSEGASPTVIDVLRRISDTGLFAIPDILRSFVASESDPASDSASGDSVQSDERNDEVMAAWESSLAVPYLQLEAYARYVSGKAPFGTHQGVKGLEFPRVLVVLDDQESRGFLFSYDKLLGAKAKSDTDVANERAGKETSIDRTRRLFYVTCSRAERSLAVVYYTADPNKVRDYAVEEGWFEPGEIEIM